VPANLQCGHSVPACSPVSVRIALLVTPHRAFSCPAMSAPVRVHVINSPFISVYTVAVYTAFSTLCHLRALGQLYRRHTLLCCVSKESALEAVIHPHKSPVKTISAVCILISIKKCPFSGFLVFSSLSLSLLQAHAHTHTHIHT
jgi:hypothetical protein